jgi:hypothetical protein
MSDHFIPPQRVLIISSHPLFGKGLVSLLEENWREGITIVGLVSTLEDATHALKTLQPDSLIIDYNDHHGQEELLHQFLKGSQKLRMVLFSLKDGDQGAEAIVYDRRKKSAASIEDWWNSISSTSARHRPQYFNSMPFHFPPIWSPWNSDRSGSSE